MYFFDDLRMLHAKEFGALPRGKAARLELRPHPPVQYDYILHPYLLLK